MISIITAIHNQKAVNQLFYTRLKQYTHAPFELIIIDNASTDGSAEYFERVGAKVIRNKENHCYPYSQNQGLAQAKYDYFALLNNDVVVSPHWDVQLLHHMKQHQLDLISACGIERIETPQATKALKKRWRMIKNPLNKLIPWGFKYTLMHRLMYGDWTQFCEKRYHQFKDQLIPGIVGNNLMMTRHALDCLGPFDERIQAADFDLFMRAYERYQQHGDIKPIHIALDTFIHHFIRITFKAKPPAFVENNQLITFKEKWGRDNMVDVAPLL